METIIQLVPEDKIPTHPIRVLGIDLGTTNSTVAEIIWNPNDSKQIEARCIEIEQFTYQGTYTNLTVPSVVAIHEGKVIIGEGAKRLRADASEKGLSQNENLFYECKNDIGVEKTYHRAEEGFRSASEIGGKLLEFLYNSAKEYDDTPISRVVVTVPASFQAAQRKDTVKAAQLAGINLSAGELLDEPIAAFLAYLLSPGTDIPLEFDQKKTLVVFDFGGGTCDIGVFALQKSETDNQLNIEFLAVSRYHRLGGGDIDAAIVYEVLIPQIIEQNGLGDFELGFEDKKKIIEPSLLGIAESLKISLCKEISRLRVFDKYDNAGKSQVLSKHPGDCSVTLEDRTLKLQSPQLTAEQFENLLKPFLRQDLLYPQGSEYRWTCSIFAPLQDALDRSNLLAEQIDYCFMVGGSSLIPQVEDAVKQFFPQATVLSPLAEFVQTAIASGAAYHALRLEMFSKGCIQPVCHDKISIVSTGGAIELIPKGVPLPYPATEQYAICRKLEIPETSLSEPLDLKVELIAGEDERLLYSKIWKIPEPVSKGEGLLLEYRFDENQVIDLNLQLTVRIDEEGLSAEIENPLTNVVNPQKERIKIDELEEKIRTRKIPRSQIPNKMVELAKMYVNLGQQEKALAYLSRVMRVKGRPDSEILNLMGIYAGELGDYEKQEEYYREAAKVSDWYIPLFNLALSQRKRGLYNDAVISIESALEKNYSGPSLVLRAILADKLNNPEDYDKYLDEAIDAFDPVPTLNKWELGWLRTGTRLAGNASKLKEAELELKKRSEKIEGEGGLLPATKGGK